jgi:hypothetical protein
VASIAQSDNAFSVACCSGVSCEVETAWSKVICSPTLGFTLDRRHVRRPCPAAPAGTHSQLAPYTQLRRKLLDELRGNGGSTDGSITHAHQKEIADIQAACERLEAARIELGERIRASAAGCWTARSNRCQALSTALSGTMVAEHLLPAAAEADRSNSRSAQSHAAVLADVALERFLAMAGLHGERQQHGFLVCRERL